MQNYCPNHLCPSTASLLCLSPLPALPRANRTPPAHDPRLWRSPPFLPHSRGKKQPANPPVHQMVDRPGVFTAQLSMHVLESARLLPPQSTGLNSVIGVTSRHSTFTSVMCLNEGDASPDQGRRSWRTAGKQIWHNHSTCQWPSALRCHRRRRKYG